MSFDLISVFATLVLPLAVMIVLVRLAAAAVAQIGSSRKRQGSTPALPRNAEPRPTPPPVPTPAGRVAKKDFRVSEWDTSVGVMREMFRTLSDELELPPDVKKRLEERLARLAQGEEAADDSASAARQAEGEDGTAAEHEQTSKGPVSSLSLGDDDPFDWPTHLIDHRPPS